MDLDRRELLLGLITGTAAAGHALASAQEPAAADPSLYIPKAHRVEDRKFLHDFMEEFSFVDLVTATPALRITHIPVLLNRTEGRFGTIVGHIAEQNPQRAAFDGGHPALIVFRGPHGYISPTWYAQTDRVVPTWNFAVVHASGRPRAIPDKREAHALLSRLIARFEASVGSTGYDFSKQPEAYVDRMMLGIAPFSMEIDALEGKFKLGQDRADADKAGILTHLRGGAYHERTLYELTDAFYRNGMK
jgi:transcriptional regulator